MNKYVAFFKISLQKSLEYRARIFIWFCWDTVPVLMMLVFWTAAFKNYSQVANYTLSSMVIYYLIIALARNLVLSHPEETLYEEIYSGKISNYIVRPANLIILKLFYELAYKFLKFFYLIPLFIFSYFSFQQIFLMEFKFSLLNLFLFIIFSLNAFLLYFFIKIFIGLLSFWYSEIEWLSSTQEVLVLFFGGTLFPLDLLPTPMITISKLLPFRYITYIPSQILLGRLNISQIINSFIILFIYLFIFVLLVKIFFKKGLKIYSFFGG